MLHDVELVIDDRAVRSPLFDAQTVRLLHVQAGGLNPAPLPDAESPLKELVQALFLPLPPEPQRLAGFQVAHHAEKLLFLPQIDLIHAHLAQPRLPTRRAPALQIAQIDRPDRARRQPKLSATCLADAISQASPTASSNLLENGALLGESNTVSRLTPQFGQLTR